MKKIKGEDKSLRELTRSDWFISELDAYEEDEYRVQTLRRVANLNYQNPFRRYSNGSLHDLADKIERCGSHDFVCQSVACKRCNREFTICKVDIIHNEMTNHPKIKYKVVTIVQYSRAIAPYEIADYDVRSDKERLRKLIIRCGITGPVFGMFEIDFHQTPNLWLPHYHLVLEQSNENLIGLEMLKIKLKKIHSDNIYQNIKPRPILAQDIKNPLKQISYVYKILATEIRDFTSVTGSRITKKYRLDDLLFSEYLCWADELGRR